MTMSLSLAWQSVGLAFHLVGAIAAIAVVIVLARGQRRFGSADPAIAGALLFVELVNLGATFDRSPLSGPCGLLV